MAAFALPASATVYTYGFDLTNLTSATKSTSGSGGTISVTASAWNANYDSGTGKYKVTSGTLGLYDHGIGVTSGYDDLNLPNNPAPGDYNTHQIDNMGNTANSSSIDFVQLNFSKAVTLSSLGRYAFAVRNSSLTNNGNIYDYTIDDDLSWGKGANVAANQQVTALSNLFQNSGWGTNSTGDSTGICPYDSNTQTCSESYTMMSNSALATTTTASYTWYVAASILPNYGGDGQVDAFKLSNVSVYYNTLSATAVVPEPSSWALMIVGFGAIGGALRRRRASGLAIVA